ncbi:HAD hydrolase-like protein [Streptomyces sp. SID3343]|uniref:HAD family hydrolase n=1 Tax=Streptomyces sp. SID3343 TaxID=2690260 RepID=UPI00136DE338|nr:HAD hydrolase-like protein [Streptomyces sp. SID3343]MYW00660.1 HAD hydrolase-like protein [Streptomyces sp. SID3343]
MTSSRQPHLVWDWNSTLFHDMDAIIAATNASFAVIGFPPITLERYRELYCVPVPRFYEKVTGRVPGPDEWLLLDEAFQRSYATHSAVCELTPEADALLDAWQRDGGTQSLLSLTAHEDLLPFVRRFGIEQRFVRVDGRVGPAGGGKAEHLVRHLDALRADPADVVLIGDAADDASAALRVGARAVLYAGGSHGRAGLERVGVPVVDSLTEAVALARTLGG